MTAKSTSAQGVTVTSGPSVQLTDGRTDEPTSGIFDLETVSRNGKRTPLLNYREKLADFLCELSKPPSQAALSPAVIIKDMEDEHEAAIELCIGSHHFSPPKKPNKLLRQDRFTSECAFSRNSRVVASAAGPRSGSELIPGTIVGIASTGFKGNSSATDRPFRTGNSSGSTIGIVPDSSMFQAKDSIPATTAASKKVSIGKSTTSPQSPPAIERIPQPTASKMDSHPLHKSKRSYSGVFEGHADQRSKHLCTAFKSPENERMTGDRATVESYITALQRYVEQQSVHDSPCTFSTPSVNDNVTGNPQVDVLTVSTGNRSTSNWWDTVMLPKTHERE